MAEPTGEGLQMVPERQAPQKIKPQSPLSKQGQIDYKEIREKTQYIFKKTDQFLGKLLPQEIHNLNDLLQLQKEKMSPEQLEKIKKILKECGLNEVSPELADVYLGLRLDILESEAELAQIKTQMEAKKKSPTKI